MEKPSSRIPNPPQVQDFWRKLLFLMVTAELQGDKQVTISRVRVGNRKGAEKRTGVIEQSNIDWRFPNFFQPDVKPTSDWPKSLEELKKTYKSLEELERTYKDVESKVRCNNLVPAAVARLIGIHHQNPKLAAFDSKDKAESMPFGANLTRSFSSVPTHYLYRIAVAFGFCPEHPRKYLPSSNEDEVGTLEDNNTRWVREQKFDPARFDDWAKDGGVSKKDQNACAIWKAFAGGTEDIEGRLGGPFDKFLKEWYSRASQEADADMCAGVLVCEEDKLACLVQTQKKAKAGHNDQNNRTAFAVDATHPMKAMFSLIEGYTNFWLNLSPNGSVDLMGWAYDRDRMLAFKHLNIRLTSSDREVLAEPECWQEVEVKNGTKATIVPHGSNETVSVSVNCWNDNGNGIPDGPIFDENVFQVMRQLSGPAVSFSIDYTVSAPRYKVISRAVNNSNDAPDFPLERLALLLDKADLLNDTSVQAKEDLPNEIKIFESQFIHRGAAK